MGLNEDKDTTTTTTSASTPTPTRSLKDLVLPFKILVSPFKTFSQLAQSPRVVGLASLLGLLVAFAAITIYASATKIDLNINDQRTSFVVTEAFNGWFVSSVTSTMLNILLYWLVFATGLAIISRMFAGKQTSLALQLVSLAYLLSVFIALYAVRFVIYLALPPIPFNISSWPPTSEADVTNVLNLMKETWGPLPAYQFATIFSFLGFVWLLIMGAIAVKYLREVSWVKAFAVSIIGFAVTLLLFGVPP